MKRIILVSLVLCLYSVIYAQDPEFLFRNNLKDTLKLNIDYSNAASRMLSPEVARKMLVLHKTYTYIEKGTPTAPGDRTVIKKPDIYYSVKKLNSYYNKAVKKGIISREQATKNLSLVVDKSYSIYYEDTKKFEEYLKVHKKPEEIQKAFDLVKLY